MKTENEKKLIIVEINNVLNNLSAEQLLKLLAYIKTLYKV
jgi:hypothetical protein